MKKAILIFLFPALLAGSLSAQELIAVQNGGNPAFYMLLDSAIFHAQNGDTIYLFGKVYNFGGLIIDKEIHLVGVGHHPDSTLATGYTLLIGTIDLRDGATNGSIEGIYLDGNINFANSGAETSAISGFSIDRNIFNGISFAGYFPNLKSFNNSIVNNIIRSDIWSGGNSSSNFILNNLILGSIQGLNNDVIRNNVMRSYTRTYSIENLKECLLENNYFLNGVSNVNYCTFRNNLSQDPLNPGGTNMIINPMTEAPANTFVNLKPGQNAYTYDIDLHLQPGSVGKNAGRDGTDVGIYGGNYPWKEGSLPFNPHYQKILVAPETDNQGNLNVNIRVKAQDH